LFFVDTLYYLGVINKKFIWKCTKFDKKMRTKKKDTMNSLHPNLLFFSVWYVELSNAFPLTKHVE